MRSQAVKTGDPTSLSSAWTVSLLSGLGFELQEFPRAFLSALLPLHRWLWEVSACPFKTEGSFLQAAIMELRKGDEFLKHKEDRGE